MSEQGLEDAEALRRHRACLAVGGGGVRAGRTRPSGLGRLALVALADQGEGGCDVPSQLRRVERYRAAVLAQHPGGERADGRERGLEDPVHERARVRERPGDPPGRVAVDVHACQPELLVADLPGRLAAVVVDYEVRGSAEVTLAAGGEADVGADPRDAELLAPALVVEILADDVPGAEVVQQRERVERALPLVVPRDRPVRELDRAALRDRRLQLREATGHLGRVVRVVHGHARLGADERAGEARAAERQVLQREPQGLGVGELPLEHEERRRQRGELVVVELDLVQEVVLGPQRVELLAGELVALRVERDAERDQLGAVGVEAAGERLVAHLRVALDVRLDVARRQWPPLGHQEGDERQLADQLVGVVRHGASLSPARAQAG